MNIEEKVKKEERKAHPFLFLVFLCALFILSIYFWNSWQIKMQEAQLKNIMRSEDINILMHNKDFFANVLGVDQSAVMQQMMALEDEIKQIFPKQENLGHDIAQNANVENKNKHSTNLTEEEKKRIRALQAESKNEEFQFDNSLDPVDLALRDIIVLQGKNGQESWRLKASWATLRQKAALLSLYMPTLLYTPTEKDDAKPTSLAEQESSSIKNNQKNQEQNSDKPLNLLKILNADSPAQAQEGNSMINAMARTAGMGSTTFSGNQNTSINKGKSPFPNALSYNGNTVTKDKEQPLTATSPTTPINIATSLQMHAPTRNDLLKQNFYKNTTNLVSITSERGIIIDNAKVYLKDNVYASQNEHSITGDTLLYSDETRIATFPTLSYFQSDNIEGNANVLDWHLDTKKIYGSEGVEMVWTPQS